MKKKDIQEKSSQKGDKINGQFRIWFEIMNTGKLNELSVRYLDKLQ